MVLSIALVISLVAGLIVLPDTGASQVNNDPGTNASFPDAAVSPDGAIFVAYQDNRHEPSNGDIFLARSWDGGISFGDPSTHVLVYDDDPSSATQSQPSICIDSRGIVHVVFTGGTTNRLFYTRSEDGGDTFSGSKQVDDAPGGTTNVAQYPTVCADGLTGHVYIAWRDHRASRPQAYYAVSSDGGASFGPNSAIHPTDATVNQSSPSIVVDGSGTVIAAWHDNSEGSLNAYYAISGDYGESFEFKGRIDGGSPPGGGVRSSNPSLAIDSMGRAYATFVVDSDYVFDPSNPNHAVGIAVREFNGTFSQQKLVTSFDGSSSPEIAALDGGLLFLMYARDVTVGQEVYRAMFYTSSMNVGSSFRSESQVDPGMTSNLLPSIAPLESGEVTLVWQCNDGSDQNIASSRVTESFPERVTAALSPPMVNASPGQTIELDVRVDRGGTPEGSCTVEFFSDTGGEFSAIENLDVGHYRISYTVPDVAYGTKIAISSQAHSATYPRAGSMARVMVIENQPPVAAFSGNDTGMVWETLWFDASESHDPDGSIVSYEWDFGDGTTGYGVIVSHAYDHEGVFNVTLTVTDDDGASTSTQQQVAIEGFIPEFSNIMMPIAATLLIFLLWHVRRRAKDNRES